MERAMKDMLVMQSLAAAAVLLLFLTDHSLSSSGSEGGPSVLKLPSFKTEGNVALEKTLAQRRSVRDFRGAPVTLLELSQILWAAQGVTNSRGFRTAPSAGALYPLEVFVVAGRVDGLTSGVYRYKPAGHELLRVFEGDRRGDLASSALNQSWVKDAPACIVIAAVFDRTTGKYRERGVRYVHMEAGHAAQNVCLQAVALGLGTVVVGAFQDREVKQVLHMLDSEEPLAIIPLGRIR